MGGLFVRNKYILCLLQDFAAFVWNHKTVFVGFSYAGVIDGVQAGGNYCYKSPNLFVSDAFAYAGTSRLASWRISLNTLI